MSNTLKHQTKDGGALSSPTHSWRGMCPCYPTTSRTSAALRTYTNEYQLHSHIHTDTLYLNDKHDKHLIGSGAQLA